MTEDRKCPKCGGNLEEGKFVARYNILSDLGTYFKNKEKRSVTAYACKKCGYIELYKEMDPKGS